MSTSTRVWLITGTSAGIGGALVKGVIADGERVAAITRNASGVSALSEAYPSDKLLVVEYDVGNAAHNVEVLFEKVHAHFGRIDVVVNNAGYGLNSVVEGASDEDARYQFEVNFWGAARITREAVKYFRKHHIPAGRVLNISSVGGFIGYPSLAYYSASKFALEGFSEGFQKELRPEWNIKIISVQPGGVKTEWSKCNMVDRPLPPGYDYPENPAQKMRDLVKNNFASDAVKVSHALIKISKEANPPLRLPLGNDSHFLVLKKLGEIKSEVEQWEELTLSTVADDADPLLYEKLNAAIDKNT